MHQSKVYLVTRRAGYNFGSSLQAYALQQIFLRRGYDCEILDVKEMRMRGRIRIWVLNFIGIVLKVLPALRRITGQMHYSRFVQSFDQRRKFDKFNNECLRVSRPLHCNGRLQKYIGSGNIIICGSDQIWNPVSFNPVMYMSFADPVKNRLAAYAPSFGVEKIEEHKTEIADYVGRIEYLSIREKAGALLLKELTGREVPVLLDPTLVVDKSVWQNIEEPVDGLQDKRYILCYFLQTDMVPRDYIASMAKQCNAEIINVQTNYSACIIDGADNRADIGPGNFLYLVKHAHWVITNSFHCCIFAHIYGKDFSVFSRFASTDKANQNSRIDTLLKVIGEQNRWIDNICSCDDGYLKEADLRERSLQFIDGILK